VIIVMGKGLSGQGNSGGQMTNLPTPLSSFHLVHSVFAFNIAMPAAAEGRM